MATNVPMIVVGLLSLAITVLIARALFVWNQIYQNRKNGTILNRRGVRSFPRRTLIVLGSGGHTTELLSMTKHLDLSLYNPIIYCKAASDTTSGDRIHTLHGPGRTVYDLPRAREVGQSYFSSVGTTLYAFWLAAYRVWFEWKPELILCNGPGTCVPICAAALLGHLLWGRPCPIVFVESFCRVETLSLTGRLLYYSCADLFIVHWEKLQQRYPRSIVTTAIVATHRVPSSALKKD